MCGVAGIVSSAPGPDKRAGLSRMLAALEHRGPDDVATEQDEHAVLGHRRLSIIDPRRRAGSRCGVKTVPSGWSAMAKSTTI